MIDAFVVDLPYNDDERHEDNFSYLVSISFAKSLCVLQCFFFVDLPKLYYCFLVCVSKRYWSGSNPLIHLYPRGIFENISFIILIPKVILIERHLLFLLKFLILLIYRLCIICLSLTSDLKKVVMAAPGHTSSPHFREY